MAMSSESEANLQHADRHSETVRLVFRDGTAVTARIRDVEWETHRTLTYLDMDGLCGARIVSLDEIASVKPGA